MLKSLILAASLLVSSAAQADTFVLEPGAYALSLAGQQDQAISKAIREIKMSCAAQLDQQPDSQSPEMRYCFQNAVRVINGYGGFGHGIYVPPEYSH